MDDSPENLKAGEYWIQGKRAGRVDGLKEAAAYVMRITSDHFTTGRDEQAKLLRALGDNLYLTVHEAEVEARKHRK